MGSPRVGGRRGPRGEGPTPLDTLTRLHRMQHAALLGTDFSPVGWCVTAVTGVCRGGRVPRSRERSRAGSKGEVSRKQQQESSARASGPSGPARCAVGPVHDRPAAGGSAEGWEGQLLNPTLHCGTHHPAPPPLLSPPGCPTAAAFPLVESHATTLANRTHGC